MTVIAHLPGQFEAQDHANLDYKGYRYRPEQSRHYGVNYIHHWVHYPCGYHEMIRFSAGFTLTPGQFRLLVDLDLPEPSEFKVGLKGTGVYDRKSLQRIATYREDYGVYDIDVMLVMMTLAEYSIWTDA